MVWNLGGAITYLRKHAKPKSQEPHECAKYVRLAIEAGGINTTGRPVSAYKYKDFLPTIGFKAVGKITGKTNQTNWTKNNARPGDIAVMDHGVHGHICMFDGKHWISDFVQNNMWVYGGDGTCYIFRYNGEIDPTLDAYQDVYSTGLRYNVPINMQEDHKLINDIIETRRNIVLGILENIGDFGLPMKYDTAYENEISGDDSSLSESLVETGMYWAVDEYGIPIEGMEEFVNSEYFGRDGAGSLVGASPMISTGQTKANAQLLISKLMNDLGLTKAQAAGIAGVLTAESGINPGSVNIGEKTGKYHSSNANNKGTPYGTKHSPWSYGAGICQWTFTSRKETAIMGGLHVTKERAIQIIKGGGIESLSLEQQISMLEYELRNSYKYTLRGILKCNGASQSAATYYCHAIAGYSTSSEPASHEEIRKMNAKYAKVGANSQINKGMRFAEGYMTNK